MNWQDRLTHGQRALLDLAKTDPNPLMASANVLRALTAMAELLDQAEISDPPPPPPPLPVSRIVLPVPDHSQWEGDAELIRKD